MFNKTTSRRPIQRGPLVTGVIRTLSIGGLLIVPVAAGSIAPAAAATRISHNLAAPATRDPDGVKAALAAPATRDPDVTADTTA